MKFKSIQLLLVLLVIGMSVNGQSYTFKVLANKGTNEVKSDGNWKPLKIGASLSKSDELKLGSGAYLGLMHHSGKTMELKNKEGSLKVADLDSKVINTKSSSVASKYADYVLSKAMSDEKSSKLKATGAVDRALKDEIQIHIPGTSIFVYNETVLIEWEPVTDVDNPVYVISVISLYGDQIISKSLKENSYVLDLSKNELKPNEALLVTISLESNKDRKSKRVAIKKLNDEKSQIIAQDLKEIQSDVGEPSALNMYILGGFYEQNGLILDALYYYEQAIQKAPDVESYQDAYEEFLYRNNLK